MVAESFVQCLPTGSKELTPTYLVTPHSPSSDHLLSYLVLLTPTQDSITMRFFAILATICAATVGTASGKEEMRLAQMLGIYTYTKQQIETTKSVICVCDRFIPRGLTRVALMMPVVLHLRRSLLSAGECILSVFSSVDKSGFQMFEYICLLTTRAADSYVIMVPSPPFAYWFRRLYTSGTLSKWR